MKFRKEDGARLKAPCASVVILDMSDRFVTSRVVIDLLLSRRVWMRWEDGECGLDKRASESLGRNPLNHWGAAMTKWVGQADCDPTHCKYPILCMPTAD